jgi:hypothetical protein
MSQKIKTSVEIDGSLKASQIENATVDTDKFLVSDGGTVKYRTGAEMLSDLGVVAGTANHVQHQVKAGVAISKGQAVYVTSDDGTNMIVGLASNDSEATSSKTMGLLNATVLPNGFADVITEGLLSGLNTSAAVVGNPVWLGVNGNLIYGLANKPYAPNHLVFIGIVTRVNNNNGEIFVKVQNGFELNEIHDVDLYTTTPTGGNILAFEGAPVNLWRNKTIPSVLGYTPVSQARTLTINGTTFDLSADRSWTIASGVTSFNTRTGAITLTSGDVTGALGYTPYNATNPNGYISSYTETDPTVPSHVKSITTTEKSNWDTAYGWGNHASAGYALNNHTHIISAIAESSVSPSGISIQAGPGGSNTQGWTYPYGTKLSAITGAGRSFEIMSTTYPDGQLVLRTLGSGGTWDSWKTILDTSNYSTYAVPLSRTITINGTSYDLSANRSWTVTANETDTLSTVTGRGNTTTSNISANGVRIGRNFGLANRATVRLDSNGDYPADVLFGRDVNYADSSWNGVYWSLSSRGSNESNSFRLYRGIANTGTTELVVLDVSTGGSVVASGDFRAPMFYDSNNTGYYLDPNGGSNLNNVTANEFYSNGWFRNNTNNTGLYNQANANHFYSRGASRWGITGNSTGSDIYLDFYGNHQTTYRGSVHADTNSSIGFLTNDGGWGLRIETNKNAHFHGNTVYIGADGQSSSNIIMRDGDHGDRQIHCNSNRVGFLNQSGGWGSWCEDNGNWISDTSIQSPIFYDYNDTTYYVNPDSTSVISTLKTARGIKDTSNVRILMPEGGSYVTTASTITGAIRILLPTQGSAMMMTCTVKVYEYSTNKSFTITFGGHRNSANWHNEFCYMDGGENRNNLTVRFGLDSGKDCVYIGETDTVWSYPQVFVTDVELGYTGYNTTWESGWSVGFVTSFPDVRRTQTAYRKLTTSNYSSYALPLSGGAMTGQIYAPSFGTGVYDGAIQIRETGYVLATQYDWGYAPAITFHWGNRFVKKFGARSDGQFAVDDVPIVLANGGTWSINIAGNATTVGNASVNTLRGNVGANPVNFTVGGDANTYYPVQISPGGQYGFNRYSIYRGYSEAAPWDPIGTGVHKGGLTFTFDWSSDIAWGGNDQSYRVMQFNETYTTMVAGMTNPVTGGMIVWLRGGGAAYHLQGPNGINHDVTVYYSGYTAANGSFFGVRTNLTNVAGEIMSKYPIRDHGDGQMFVNNSKVLYEGSWINSKYFGTDGNIYAAKFSDSDDGSYYVEPAASSILYNLTLNGAKHTYLHINPGNGYEAMVRYDGGSGNTWYVGKRTTSTTQVGTEGFHFYSTAAGDTVAGIDTAGTFKTKGDVVAYSSSDRELKDNISPIQNALQKVKQIGGYEFDWNDKQTTYEGHDIGIIAQEIEAVLPEVVTTRDTGFKAVKYEKIVPLLIEAIKEQQTQIEELKELVNKLINK